MIGYKVLVKQLRAKNPLAAKLTEKDWDTLLVHPELGLFSQMKRVLTKMEALEVDVPFVGRIQIAAGKLDQRYVKTLKVYYKHLSNLYKFPSEIRVKYSKYKSTYDRELIASLVDKGLELKEGLDEEYIKKKLEYLEQLRSDLLNTTRLWCLRYFEYEIGVSLRFPQYRHSKLGFVLETYHRELSGLNSNFYKEFEKNYKKIFYTEDTDDELITKEIADMKYSISPAVREQMERLLADPYLTLDKLIFELKLIKTPLYYPWFLVAHQRINISILKKEKRLSKSQFKELLEKNNIVVEKSMRDVTKDIRYGRNNGKDGDDYE